MFRFLSVALLLLVTTPVFAATDSYRWLHVTIDTPWAIFIFLLPMVLLPVIIMAILYWRYATKKLDGKTAEELAARAAAKENKQV